MRFRTMKTQNEPQKHCLPGATSIRLGCLVSVNGPAMNRLPLQVLLACFAVACGSGTGDHETRSDASAKATTDGNTSTTDAADAAQTDGGDSGGHTGDAAFTEATHPGLPQLLVQGGTVLTAPQVVTVTFPSDPNAAELGLFGETVTNNSWWNTIRTGFCATTATCVGDGPAGISVPLTSTPASSYADASDPTSSSQLRIYLNGLIAAGALPAPTSQTIYVLYFPSTTTISLDGSVVCKDLSAYHDYGTYGGMNYAYAVAPECAGSPIADSIFWASHEIVEATTDPFPYMTSGYWLNLMDPNILPWLNSVGGGEAADLCYDPWQIGQDQAKENGFTVERIWNNQKAVTGHNPCVPESTAPYFNAAPDKWLLTAAVGSSASFTATVFSDSPLEGGWSLSGYDYQGSLGTIAYLKILINGAASAKVNNGDKVTVSVTLLQDPGVLTSSNQYPAAVGWLTSYLGPVSTPTAAHYWPFMITSPADAASSGLACLDATED
jgi:hypothetical protein